MKLNFKKAIAVLGTTIAAFAACTLTASAATEEEFIAACRAQGLPELAIQSGLNYIHNEGKTSPEDYDYYIECLTVYEDEIWANIEDIFGIPRETTTPAATTTVVTTTGPNGETEPTTTTTTTTTAITENAGIDDGVKDWGITSAQWINMTLDEKIAFVNSLPEADRATFLYSLNADERVSIIKQMSTDNKVNIVGTLTDIGKEMGLNITVDELTGDSLTLSVRDDDGTLVDVSSVGTGVEDTGISYKGLISCAVGLMLAAGAGITVLARKLKKGAQNG